MVQNWQSFEIADKKRKLVSVQTLTHLRHAKALEFGAEGIGLCRTEHMFMGSGQITICPRNDLSAQQRTTTQAFGQFEEFQTKDFYDILKIMADKPVTIRF